MAEPHVISRSYREDTGERPQFKVWVNINGNENVCYAVDSPDVGIKLIGQLILEHLQDSSIFMNAFGLEELEADGYHEWYNDERNSASALALPEVKGGE